MVIVPPDCPSPPPMPAAKYKLRAFTCPPLMVIVSPAASLPPPMAVP